MTPLIRWQDHIESNPKVLAGKSVFKGTRLSVEFILRQLSSGMSFDEMLQEYPSLQRDHLRAAMAYAADMAAMEA